MTGTRWLKVFGLVWAGGVAASATLITAIYGVDVMPGWAKPYGVAALIAAVLAMCITALIWIDNREASDDR